MLPKRVDVCVIHTTPSQLRALADRLEALWRKAKLGQEVPFETVYGPVGFEVRFVIDQDEQHREDRQQGPK